MDNKYNLASKKDNAIDYIRVISMAMIVLCHYFMYYDNVLAWWFNVGVQVFFLISGFLYSGRDIGNPVEFIAKQFKKILVPYYIFMIPVTVLYVLFARDAVSAGSIIKVFLCAGTLQGIEHLWFIPYILLSYLITPYLYWFAEKVKQWPFLKMTVAFAALLGIYMVLGIAFDSHFAPDRIACYIIGYYIAVYYKKYGQKAIKIMAGISIPVGTIASVVRGYMEYGLGLAENPVWGTLFSYYQRVSRMLLGIALFFAMYILLKKAKANKIIQVLSQYSYSIYIVHQLFITGVLAMMDITGIMVVNWLIVLAAIAVSAIALQFATNKVNKLCRLK